MTVTSPERVFIYITVAEVMSNMSCIIGKCLTVCMSTPSWILTNFTRTTMFVAVSSMGRGGGEERVSFKGKKILLIKKSQWNLSYGCLTFNKTSLH